MEIKMKAQLELTNVIHATAVFPELSNIGARRIIIDNKEEEGFAILETPYFVPGNPEATAENIKYAEACLRDSLLRGEAPYASHLINTRVTDDNFPEQRKLGIEAGLRIGKFACKTIVYTDRGISPGMKLGIEHARKHNRPVIFRKLYKDERELRFEKAFIEATAALIAEKLAGNIFNGDK